MSEPSILLIVALLCIPLSNIVLAAIFFRILKHMSDTQIVGGTPVDVYKEKAALEVEAGRVRVEARKPKPFRKVLS